MGPREAELTADCQVLRTLATQVGICHPSGSGGQRRGQASPRWLGSLVYALWTVAGRADLNAQLRAWLAIANARPWRVLGSAPTDRTTADRVARLVLPPDAAHRPMVQDAGPRTATSGWTGCMNPSRQHEARHRPEHREQTPNPRLHLIDRRSRCGQTRWGGSSLPSVVLEVLLDRQPAGPLCVATGAHSSGLSDKPVEEKSGRRGRELKLSQGP
jgi:hypothetical protein